MAEKLTLDDNDPKVVKARNAEKELFNHYGLYAKDHYITMPAHDSGEYGRLIGGFLSKKMR